LFPDEVIKFVATVKPRRLLCGGEVKMANSFVTLVACTTNCTIEIVRRKCVRIPSRPEIATNQKMLIAKRRATTAHLKLFLLVLQALLSPSCALSRRSDQICCNCKTQKTSLWRRSQNGEFICNPCGLYYKLHNRDRPQEMRKDSIQTRNRNKPKNANRKKASNNSPPETVPISPPGPSFTILRKFKITHYINLSIDTMNCGIVNFASYAIDSYSALSRRSDQICCNCKTQKTSLWRRSQNGEFICNPCGLYYKLHNRDRPQEMRKDSIQTRNRNKPKNANRKKASNNSPPETVPISPPGPSFTILLLKSQNKKKKKGPALSRRSDQICCNCKTQKTSLWRRSQNGEFICNPCGLYYKLHNRDRPQEMRKDSIQTRNRNKPKNANRKKASNNSPPETVPISPPGPSFTILHEVIKFVATVKPRRLLCGGEVKMANSFVTLVACTTNCTIEIVRRKCVRIPSRPEIATNQKMLIAKRRATTAHLKLFLLVLQALLSPSCALSRRSDQICCNCKTQKTSLWRRSQNGEFICNPCGLYYKLHN
ncbi:GATA-binding factor C, partial [Trichonephila clavata]